MALELKKPETRPREGVSIQIKNQRSRQKTRSITIYGGTVEEVYNRLKAYFKALERHGDEETPMELYVHG